MMDKAPHLLYGELVNLPREEEMSSVHEEVEAMKEQTRLMIEEAAYFLAQKRGFAPGFELQDWLQAEAQIDKAKSGK